MSETFNTHPVRFLKSGAINVGGKIYYGVVNGDPVNVPGDRINIFANRGLTTALPNPISTGLDGRTAVNGVPAKVWLGERHSLFELDKFNVEQFQDLDRGETTGTGTPIKLTNVQGINAITAQAEPTITGYVDQQIYLFKTVSTNTGNITLDIDGQDAKSVKFNFNEEIKPGFFQATQDMAVKYNDTGSPTTDYFSWMDSGRAISILTGVAGDGNTITAEGGPSITGYVDQQQYSFKPNVTNTGDATLKVGSRPTVSIKDRGGEAQPGQLIANKITIVTYNSVGPVFELVKNQRGLSELDGPKNATGSSVDFTDIPAGTKKIIVIFNDVKISAAVPILVRINNEATGYASIANKIINAANPAVGSVTTGFHIIRLSGSDRIIGQMILTRANLTANIWVSSHSASDPGGATYQGAGSKTTSAELNQINVVTTSGNFDSGAISIQFE